MPPDVLTALAAGAPSVNHMEQMAMDAGALLTAMFPQASARAVELDTPRFLDRLRAGASIVWDLFGLDVFDLASGWRSDTARGWAAFAIVHTNQDLRGRLDLVRNFADDTHFAVREWAWLALRSDVIADPLHALSLLEPWTRLDSPRLRRFAVEVTRPRGVWSAHIPLFKTHPETAQALLDASFRAPERYVRDSVANWVNDASRTRPDWVLSTCTAWEHRAGDEVTYVCRRARRSLV